MKTSYTYQSFDELAKGLGKSRNTINKMNDDGEIIEVFKITTNAKQTRSGFLHFGSQQNWHSFLFLAFFLGNIPSFVGKIFRPEHLAGWFHLINEITIVEITFGARLAHTIIIMIILPIIIGLMVTPVVVTKIRHMEFYEVRIGVFIYWAIWCFLLLVSILNFIIEAIGKQKI